MRGGNICWALLRGELSCDARRGHGGRSAAVHLRRRHGRPLQVDPWLNPS